ncbi:MAG: hypothetical protein AB8F65_08335 [Woeseiaceae bacterium]
MKNLPQRLAAVGCLVMLGACAAPVSTELSDGTFAYKIDCDGTARGLNYCLEKAGKSCGAKGYTLVSEAGERLSNSDAVSSDSQAFFKDYAGDRNRIYYQCGT